MPASSTKESRPAMSKTMWASQFAVGAAILFALLFVLIWLVTKVALLAMLLSFASFVILFVALGVTLSIYKNKETSHARTMFNLSLSIGVFIFLVLIFGWLRYFFLISAQCLKFCLVFEAIACTCLFLAAMKSGSPTSRRGS